MKPKKLPPTEELRETFNYDPDTGILTWKIKGKGITKERAGYLGGLYYKVKYKQRLYPLHRIVYKLFYGDFDETMLIDHIDRDTHNNRICNLRVVTASGNMMNQKVFEGSQSGCHGVTRCHYRDLWKVTYKSKYLGYFYRLEDAIECRKRAERADSV